MVLDHSGKTQVGEGAMKSACVLGHAPSQASCPGSLRCIYATGFLPEPHLRERHKLQDRTAKEQNGFLRKLLLVLPKGGVATRLEWDRHGQVPGGAGSRVHCFLSMAARALEIRPLQKRLWAP